MNTELIPIQQNTIDGETVDTVNARELHTFLESKQQFSDWIHSRIEKYGFSENVDFLIVSENYETNTQNGQRRVSIRNDYHITLDMAKELAMVERTAKGREARQYFIQCEKQLKQLMSFSQQSNHDEWVETLEGELAIALLRSRNFEKSLVSAQQHYSSEIERLQQLNSMFHQELTQIHLHSAKSVAEVACYFSVSLQKVLDTLHELQWFTGKLNDDFVMGDNHQLGTEALNQFWVIAQSELKNDAFGRERCFRQVFISRKGMRVLAKQFSDIHAVLDYQDNEISVV